MSKAINSSSTHETPPPSANEEPTTCDPTLAEVECLQHDVDRLLILSETLRKILKEDQLSPDQLLVQLARRHELDFIEQ